MNSIAKINSKKEEKATLQQCLGGPNVCWPKATREFGKNTENWDNEKKIEFRTNFLMLSIFNGTWK
jgi:hypothetical protein